MNEIRIENFLYPYVRFLNALPDAREIDAYVGNTLAASKIAFGSFSPYIKVTKGKQEIRITPSGSKENTLAILTINFFEGEVYTVAAASDNKEIIAYGINEPTLRENIDYGHIRICHLSQNTGRVDIEANNYDILSDINYLELSSYIAISPGKYDFKVRNSETSEIILNVSSQNLKQGFYNTLYLIGLFDSSPKLQAILTVDAASYNGYYL